MGDVIGGPEWRKYIMNSLFHNNLHVKQILEIAPNWRFINFTTILDVFSTVWFR